jgi:hypothetical protein
MDSFLQVELTPHEREILLRGLRYVRSSILLQLRDPCPEDQHHRAAQLDQIQGLSKRLESSDAMGAHI